NPEVVTVDADEWPGRDRTDHYRRDDSVLHIELRRWADLFIIAPLDANTLAKLAAGLADNCLACVWRAWDVARPVVLAPAMNTLMWDHPLTARHLATLTGDNTYVHVVGPVTKGLACGDVGVGAMAEVAEIVAAVRSEVGGTPCGFEARGRPRGGLAAAGGATAPPSRPWAARTLAWPPSRPAP